MRIDTLMGGSSSGQRLQTRLSFLKWVMVSRWPELPATLSGPPARRSVLHQHVSRVAQQLVDSRASEQLVEVSIAGIE